jgi:hypothetical protein
VVLGAMLGLASPSLTPPREASACAPAPRAGEHVRVASETAVIVWDETAGRQHFIRRASFRGTARDFGFLVPTPSRPELAEIDDSIFDSLGWATRPRVIEKRVTSGVELTSCAFLFLGARSAAIPSAAGVRVVEETTVAGYDAAVLQADDAGALAAWLKERGYAEGPSLTGWLAPYVEKRWMITAFKVADPAAAKAPAPADPGAARPLGTSAVRMTFATDRPLFPYREPADQRAALPPEARSADGPRELLLYVIASKRMAATIGESGAFPGSTPFAKRIDLPPALVPLAAGIADPMTTVMLDNSSPRPGTDDLWLAPSGEQGEVEPPPIVHEVGEPVPIPVEPVLAIGGIATALLVRCRRRAR